MKNGHLLRYPHSSSLRRTPHSPELRDALYLNAFDQPASQVLLCNLEARS
jgi:hypothetical protein